MSVSSNKASMGKRFSWWLIIIDCVNSVTSHKVTMMRQLAGILRVSTTSHPSILFFMQKINKNVINVACYDPSNPPPHYQVIYINFVLLGIYIISISIKCYSVAGITGKSNHRLPTIISVIYWIAENVLLLLLSGPQSTCDIPSSKKYSTQFTR